MKTTKNFQIGDKVFAKVKGYPAWPAKIVGESGKKYNVRFYGTGESGTIKVEDLFHYMRHKDQFNKPLKRKDFRDAIEEIERDIQNGNSGIEEQKNTTSNKRGSKRSFPTDSDNNVTQQKKHRRSSASSISKDTDEDVTQENVDSSTVESDVTEEAENKQLSHSENVQNKEIKTLTEDDVIINFSNTPNPQNKYVFVSVEYLQGIVAYGEHVKNNKPLFERKADPRSLNKEILTAKVSEQELVGIECSITPPSNCNTEYEVAQHETAQIKKILDLKKDLESGKITREEVNDFAVHPLNIKEHTIYSAVNNKSLENKKSKLQWLKIESNLLQYDSKIKAALALDKANPREALEYMELTLKLDVDPLMLKKHPHVMDMVRRLRKYIGNVDEWDMKGDELQEFLRDAEVIRKKAEEVYLKFREFFDVPADNFWDAFTAIVEDFKNQTKDLSENRIFSLRFEPNTRDAFLDNYLEMEELKLCEKDKNDKIVEKQQSEKENVEDTAEKTEDAPVNEST